MIDSINPISVGLFFVLLKYSRRSKRSHVENKHVFEFFNVLFNFWEKKCVNHRTILQWIKKYLFVEAYV